METFFFLNFYQNDVISDLADAFPGDNILIFPTEKAAESARSGNNQSSETSGFAVKFYIRRASEAAAGTGIDDFFLFQFTYSHRKTCIF